MMIIIHQLRMLIYTLVTVSEEDLLNIYELATGRDKPESR